MRALSLLACFVSLLTLRDSLRQQVDGSPPAQGTSRTAAAAFLDDLRRRSSASASSFGVFVAGAVDHERDLCGAARNWSRIIGTVFGWPTGAVASLGQLFPAGPGPHVKAITGLTLVVGHRPGLCCCGSVPRTSSSGRRARPAAPGADRPCTGQHQDVDARGERWLSTLLDPQLDSMGAATVYVVLFAFVFVETGILVGFPAR